ncbi:MAG: hypothetical protein C0391_09165 [Anaerolinea sp.]|nr:hypothetical protein [Anaerolinea sp.]
MKIYFARHAESEANISNVISNRGWQHPLTENGKQQAEHLGERLKEAGISGIFASPIMRAIHTAQIVGEVIKAPVAAADALREFDCGAMEGRSDNEAWFEVGHAMRQWLEQGDLDYRISAGESYSEVLERFRLFITKVIAIGGEGSFLFVSHGGTLRLALPQVIKDLSPTLYQDHFFNYTDYAVTEVVEGSLVCVEWCGQRTTS